MGLFGAFGGKKKICALCGGKVGLLGYKLAEGQFLCSDCRSGCTPGTNLDFKSMTPDDVRANIAVASENQRKGQEEFKATRQFFTGAGHDKPVIFVDENHGWFMNAAKEDGWVYNIDDISYYNMRLSTTPLEEEDKKGFLDWLFAPDFYSAYPELPQCPFNEKIIGAYLTIRLLDNELGVTDFEVDVFPGFFTTESDVRGSYECCHDFYQFMQEWRMHRNAAQNTSPAAPAEAAPAASGSEDITETLTKLHGLLQAGILTQEEFDSKKKQLLGL